MKKPKAVPQSFLTRGAKLFKSSALMVTQEIAARTLASLSKKNPEGMAETRIKQALELVSTLGDLRGAAMKAGQLLSLELSDLLPKEVVTILSQLHDQSSQIPFSDVKKILIKELGEEKFSKLIHLSHEPIAAASIGQVHSATINGQKVAIKVQFPGVAKSIDNDLAVLKKIVQGLLFAFGKSSMRLEDIFLEIKTSLKKEVDYHLEAASIREFQEAFADDKRFVIPQVFSEFSSKRVLTMSFESGTRIREWLNSEPEAKQVKVFSDLVLSLLIKEFFELGMMQTDPNYGNFLYRQDLGQIVLLDFGATKTFSKKFRKDLIRLIKTAETSNDAALISCANSLGLIDPRENENVEKEFIRLMSLVTFMFREENQPFSFNNPEYLQNVRSTTLTLIRNVHYSAPARQLIFLNRKLGGMFHLLKEAGGKINMRPYWEKVNK